MVLTWLDYHRGNTPSSCVKLSFVSKYINGSQRETVDKGGARQGQIKYEIRRETEGWREADKKDIEIKID